MKLYTKEQLMKAAEYGAGYQKACDYQDAGHILITDINEKPKIEDLLDELSDTDNNCISKGEVKIEEILEYLNTK